MDEKQMKKAVFHVFHIGKCGKWASECGKPEEKRRFCKENHRFDCGKEKESGKRNAQKLKSLMDQGFAGFWTKADRSLWHVEKLWIKNFFMWESMWKMLQNRVKPSFFGTRRRKMTVFDTHI